jgi:hypothetical protein
MRSQPQIGHFLPIPMGHMYPGLRPLSDQNPDHHFERLMLNGQTGQIGHFLPATTKTGE